MIYDSEPGAGGLFYTPGCGLEPLYPELWEGCVLATLGPQERGIKARDRSGRGGDGTLTGGPVWTEASHRGQAFQGLRLDGTNDYAIISQLGIGTGPFSASFWLNDSSAGDYTNSYGAGVLKNTQGDAAGSWMVTVTDSQTIQLWDWKTTGTDATGRHTTVATIAHDTWAHCVVTRDTALTNAIYINRVPSALTDSTTFSGWGTQAFIGTNVVGAGYYFCGLLSAISVYRRVLTGNEIATLSRHPLAAYLVRPRPRVFAFSSAVPAGNRRRRVICGS
jgi:hypothetical protein